MDVQPAVPGNVPSDQATRLASVLQIAEAVRLALTGAGGPEGGTLATRLENSVLRPLRSVLDEIAGGVRDNRGGVPTAATDAGQALAELARQATEIVAGGAAPSGVHEAAAALQDLACRLASEDETAKLKAELQAMVSTLPPSIRVAGNGPYLVANVSHVTNWLGEPLEVRPLTALCRCGQSAMKPFCDGTHAGVGFSGAKDPKRVADRRDRYPGLGSFEVLDNRGLCAHSGFCSDRLRNVFRVGKEPFVAPSGGRMDEIIRAVRSCPSGALSYALEGREAREQVDQDRGPAIEVSKDGPYRVTGAIRLVDDGGQDEPRDQGASLEHFSLCRCGHSLNKPFCSGMHWYVNFHDPLPDPDREPTLFEWAGGLPAFTRLTRRFYEAHVPEDPLLAPLFANMSPDHPERVATWLGEVFGGPSGYTDNYGGYTHMMSEHLGAHLSEAQRARFVQLLCLSADEVGLPADAEFRAAFVSYLEWGSRIALENSQPGAAPPEHMPVPHWWWVCNATPASRLSALAHVAETEEPPAPLPGQDEAPSFERHIKPLFRQLDRQSMRFAFDLWSCDEVRKHAQAILTRLKAGTMPCDGAWPAVKTAVFERWTEQGMAE